MRKPDQIAERLATTFEESTDELALRTGIARSEEATPCVPRGEKGQFQLFRVDSTGLIIRYWIVLSSCTINRFLIDVPQYPGMVQTAPTIERTGTLRKMANINGRRVNLGRNRTVVGFQKWTKHTNVLSLKSEKKKELKNSQKTESTFSASGSPDWWPDPWRC